MWQIGVWERNGELAEQVTRMARGRALVRACAHPALLAGTALDLLVVSPGATGWAGAASLTARTALLPGVLPVLTHALPAALVVSYGLSGRNTLTLSSLEDDRAAVAVQREFIALDGRAVERQELVVPCAESISPELLLAQVGCALLLGRV